MQKADVVLVQPKSGFLDYASKRLPLGIMSIAGVLREHGFNVKIIDQRIDSRGWKKDLQHFAAQNPLFVGISTMTGTQIHHALKAASVVRAIDPKIPLVWGGVHPSLTALQTIQHPSVDVCVVCEGELTSLDLANTYKKGKPVDDVLSICYKKPDGSVRMNDLRKPLDLNDLPPMPYDLIDFDKYASIDFSGTFERSVSFESSRGCPWRCGFCYIPAESFYDSKWKVFSPETVVERIRTLVDKYKVKSVYFTDDEMAIDTVRFEKIVDGLLEADLDISWGTQGIRIDTMERIMKNHTNLLDKMYKSGNKQIEVGLESGSERVLKLIQKDLTKAKMDDIIKKLTAFREGKQISVKYNLMGGFPTETRAELEETLLWAEQLTKANAHVLFNIFAPYPGTPLYPLAVQSGFREPPNLESWGDFTLFDWFHHHPSWLDKGTIDYLTSISFALLFNNKSFGIKITNRATRYAFQVYSPIAKFRLKHRFFKFFFEKKITDLLDMNSDF